VQVGVKGKTKVGDGCVDAKQSEQRCEEKDERIPVRDIVCRSEITN